MVKSLELNQQSFWGAIEALGQGKHYNVSWEDGELVIYPSNNKEWRVAVIDEFKHAFVHFTISVASKTGATTVEKEGYYLPGLGSNKAEKIILNCVSEATELKNPSVNNNMLVFA